MDSAEEEAQAISDKLAEEQKMHEKNIQLNHSSSEATSDKKIARNDPCPCGSGKKYKQCCGKSGPKKGAFAS